MFLAQKFCRIEQYNLLGRGEIRSAQGHVFCGSAFARYVHVLKENTMISGALRLRTIVFVRFFKKKKQTRGFPKRSDFGNFCLKKRKSENVTKKHEKTEKLKTHKLERGEESKNSKEREGSKRSKAGPYTPSNSRSPAPGGKYWY